MPLSKGDIFPPREDLNRIELQKEYKQIYLSKHIWQNVINKDGQQIKIDPVVPIAATISEIFSDLMFGEFPTFDFGTSQDAFDSFIKQRSLDGQNLTVDLLEASVMNSAQGMVFWNLFKMEDEVFWDFREPCNAVWSLDFRGRIQYIAFFDVVESDSKKTKYFIQEYELNDGQALFFEHNVITETQNGKIVSVDTMTAKTLGLDFIPSIPVFNTKVMGMDIGRSDYEGKQQLFAEIDNRVDQVNNVLQEHSDPWVGLPAGVLDSNGNLFKSLGKMFEKSGASSNTDNTVDHFTWDASLEAAFKQTENLIKLCYSTSRISASLSPFADFSGGNAESGRSLKWRSVTTIAAKNRKETYWGESIKLFFRYLTKMQPSLSKASADDMGITWADGLPTDEQELVDLTTKKVSHQLLSKLEGSQEVNEWDESNAQKDQDQIGKELGELADTKARSLAPITV